ncbi:unnamed protein product, partial [Rotaria sp. Silwood1]
MMSVSLFLAEKFFATLALPVVPVVLGKTDYARFIPKSGYIDTRDFPTPKNLAKYLNEIAQNQTNVKYVNYTTKHFPSYFTYIPSISWTVIDSEDLIHPNLIDCERALTDFISLLGISASFLNFESVVQYDSHLFIEDATWWDQSQVAEGILTMSISSRPSDFTYVNDFYYLHGNRSFTQYVSDSRQCYNDGIFAQMQAETVFNRASTDEPNRCLAKPFDCAFSDLFSFQDREQLYQQSGRKPLKCGFATPSIFDKVRNRYGRNYTCETIIFTSITNCYDPLPQVEGVIFSSFCFVALLDTKTIKIYKQLYSVNYAFEWDLIDLGTDATPFSVAAKSVETLKIVGQRMFPLAKWIIWLDGKGKIKDVSELLKQARAPVISLTHYDQGRTSASEVDPTMGRILTREKPLSQRLNNSLIDIKLQEKEYQRDGFYSRSETLRLK